MPTKVIKLDPAGGSVEAIQDAAALLAGGGLVVFPTETVYGVAASAVSAEGLRRLRELKGRTDGKPFTVHIAARSSAARFVGDPTGAGRRLIEKAWPGPLTLIFNVPDPAATPIADEYGSHHVPAMYHQGTIGLRCPDDRWAGELLAKTAVPVVAASANLAGAAPPLDAESALEALDGKVDLVLDAGRTRYAGASTIVRVKGDDYEILRPGVLDERTIRRLVRTHILLVCSGNTCRSPMAEAMFRRQLADKLGCNEAQLADRGYYVESAGVDAHEGDAVSPEAVAAMRARGLDISGHRSRRLTEDLVNRADHIFAMTAGHVGRIAGRFPAAQGRVKLLGDQDVMDPLGSSERVYMACADQLDEALRRRIEEVAL